MVITEQVVPASYEAVQHLPDRRLRLGGSAALWRADPDLSLNEADACTLSSVAGDEHPPSLLLPSNAGLIPAGRRSFNPEQVAARSSAQLHPLAYKM